MSLVPCSSVNRGTFCEEQTTELYIGSGLARIRNHIIFSYNWNDMWDITAKDTLNVKK